MYGIIVAFHDINISVKRKVGLKSETYLTNEDENSMTGEVEVTNRIGLNNIHLLSYDATPELNSD
jgi:hypothetical protein